MAAMRPNGAPAPLLGAEVNAAPLERASISGRRGFDLEAPFRLLPMSASGRTVVYGEELDRFELRLRDADGHRYTGYTRVGTGLRALPIGSRIDPETGVFTWAPGVGFVHGYDLVFVRWSDGQAVARREVRFVLDPKGSNWRGPQVTIDTPAANAVGVFDHAMSMAKGASYMASAGMTPAQIAHYQEMPAWMLAVWAIGVWGAMLGSVLILLRNRLAFPVFAVSLAAFLLSVLYTYVLTNGGEVMGRQMGIVSAVITALLLFFMWYSWLMAKRGVLR